MVQTQLNGLRKKQSKKGAHINCCSSTIKKFSYKRNNFCFTRYLQNTAVYCEMQQRTPLKVDTINQVKLLFCASLNFVTCAKQSGDWVSERKRKGQKRASYVQALKYFLHFSAARSKVLELAILKGFFSLTRNFFLMIRFGCDAKLRVRAPLSLIWSGYSSWQELHERSTHI